MTWMETGDPEKDRKLKVAYRHCIHITTVPYFFGERYKQFNYEVFLRMRESPFFINLSSVAEVEVGDIIWDV